jgi:hypothetical protein
MPLFRDRKNPGAAFMWFVHQCDDQPGLAQDSDCINILRIIEGFWKRCGGDLPQEFDGHDISSRGKLQKIDGQENIGGRGLVQVARKHPQPGPSKKTLDGNLA